MPVALVIDVGNTSVSLGLYKDGDVRHVYHVRGGIDGDRNACVRALRQISDGVDLDGAMIATVVPAALQGWKALVKSTLGLTLRQITHRCLMPVTIDYPKPASIGADRLADAAGAVAKYGAPALICDFGTALTFDVVSPDRRYLGGAICPGLPLMRDYLYERTAKLPKIGFDGVVPNIGRSTADAMRLGAAVGYRGMVREITEHLRRTTGYDFKLIATGGYAAWALDGLDLDFTIDQNLTLLGIGVIFDSNFR